MNNKLPIKEDNTIFGKIKKFFRNVFSKDSVEYKSGKDENLQENSVSNNEKQSSFQTSIKSELNYDYIKQDEKDDFINKLETNPSLFYELPIEKLKKLEDYYTELVQKEKEKLEKIKRAS